MTDLSAEDRFILTLTDAQTADATCPECSYVSEDYLKAQVCPACTIGEATFNV